MICCRTFGIKLLSSERARLIHTITAKPGLEALSYDLITQTDTYDEAVPPIIFLHGLLGCKRNNRSAARQLSSLLRTPVIVPDLRNHGTSFHSLEMNYEVMSDDMTKLINHLPPNIPKNRGFIMMGHSMGAKVAMIHALRYPDLVKGVISIDNPPYANSHASFITFEILHLLTHFTFKCLKQHPEWSLKQLSEYLTKWVEPNPLIVNYFVSNLEMKNGKIREKSALRILNESYEEVVQWYLKDFGDIEQFAGQANVPPLLLIRATYSEFVGADVHKHAIAKYFPQYEIQDINTSHWVVTDDTKGFIKLVKNWVYKTFKE